MFPTRLLRRRRLLYIVVLCLFVLGCLATLRVLSSSEKDTKENPNLLNQHKRKEEIKDIDGAISLEVDDADKEVEEKEIRHPAPTTIKEEHFSLPEPNYNIHIFYYAWYGNPEHDGKYVHWNHQFLPHWNPEIAKQYKQGSHSPPNDIGSNFYPVLGPYSSKDPKVIDEHMKEMRTAGVGVIVFSWYPPGKADNEGIPSDSLVPALLDAAAKYRLKLTLHIEPYAPVN